MIFDVHLHAVVRVKVPKVEAATMEEAIEKAKELADCDRLFVATTPGPVECTEFADEYTHHIVDVVGDPEYAKTQTFTETFAGLRPWKDSDGLPRA